MRSSSPDPRRASPRTRRSVESPAITLWRHFEAGAWDEARALLDPTFIARWPQSGERFSGPENYIAVNQAHPAPGWSMSVANVVDVPGVSALQLRLDHAEGTDHGACFYVVAGMRILEATEIWAERTVPPAWRAAWHDLGAA